jgi:hypothetical protein
MSRVSLIAVVSDPLCFSSDHHRYLSPQHAGYFRFFTPVSIESARQPLDEAPLRQPRQGLVKAVGVAAEERMVPIAEPA